MRLEYSDSRYDLEVEYVEEDGVVKKVSTYSHCWFCGTAMPKTSEIILEKSKNIEKGELQQIIADSNSLCDTCFSLKKKRMQDDADLMGAGEFPYDGVHLEGLADAWMKRNWPGTEDIRVAQRKEQG